MWNSRGCLSEHDPKPYFSLAYRACPGCFQCSPPNVATLPIDLCLGAHSLSSKNTPFAESLDSVKFSGVGYDRHGCSSADCILVFVDSPSMRPLKTLSLLSISPFYCSACRNNPLFAQQALRLQCLPASAPPGHPSGLSKRSSSASTSTSTSDSSFTYRIAASFSAKGRPLLKKQDTFSFDPWEERDSPYTGRSGSGQDAFFVSNYGPADENGQRKKTAFGVADGVGGWADSGIDSADFSHGLCRSMGRIANAVSKSDKSNDPQGLLEEAYNEIVKKKVIPGGGSTACVAIGDKDGNLSVAK